MPAGSFTLRIEPRPQFREYLTRKQRFACNVVHRRGGKTYACIQDLLARALTHQRKGPPLRYAYIAPTRDQAKDIAWAYLREFCGKMPGVAFNQADLTVTLPNKATIRLYSGDSYERMRGLYFDGVVIDEPADIDPAAWPSVIRPALSDYTGWATFIGTPKGRNAFWKIWSESCKPENAHEWFSMMLKSSDSGLIPAAELASIRGGTPDNIFRQEFECDFSAPVAGAIFAAAVDKARAEGRVCAMPIDGSNLVHTSWDLGSPAKTVVWYWQIVGREIRFIDCDRGFEGTLTERHSFMLAKGYNLGSHYLPHDAMQTERTGATMATSMREAGFANLVVVPRGHTVQVGINHALEMFPAFAFRTPQCDAGLDGLTAYRLRVDGEGSVVSNDPIKDWASDVADAFRYVAEAHRSGMIQFKHTTAEAKPDWFGTKQKRRGMKPAMVSVKFC